MPQPLIYALPVQGLRGSSPLLRVRLQLGLERGELGERRVRVGQFVPTVLVARPLDVFGAQIGIAVRTITAISAFRTIPPRWTRTAIITGRALGGAARNRLRSMGALRAIAALSLAVAFAPARLTRSALLPCDSLFA